MESRYIFFVLVLFAALIAIFAAMSFSVHDMLAATVLACGGLMVFLGLICHLLLGLRPWLRNYYGLCGLTLYFFFIVKGNMEDMALLGSLAIVAGLVPVLRWRLAIYYLTVVIVGTGVIFAFDLYFVPEDAFPPVVEMKFFFSLVGVTVMSLGHGYTWGVFFRLIIKSSKHLSTLVYRDSLTGLLNRTALEDYLRYRWEEYRRVGNRFSLILLKITNLDEMNEQFGRSFGDGVMIRIANVIIRSILRQDMVCRWGTDEFLILLPAQDFASAENVARRTCEQIRGIQLAMLGEIMNVSVSYGVASVEGASNLEDLNRKLMLSLHGRLTGPEKKDLAEPRPVRGGGNSQPGDR